MKIYLVLFCLCVPLIGPNKEELAKLKLEANEFFMYFSKALEKQDSAEAVMHVASNFVKVLKRDTDSGEGLNCLQLR